MMRLSFRHLLSDGIVRWPISELGRWQIPEFGGGGVTIWGGWGCGTVVDLPILGQSGSRMLLKRPL